MAAQLKGSGTGWVRSPAAEGDFLPFDFPLLLPFFLALLPFFLPLADFFALG
jgi:hypothetical protein